MTTTVKATYANGVLTPMEPLDLQEGAEVTVSIENAPLPAATPEPLVEMFDRLRASVPAEAWDDMPTDGAQNYKHYLYGHPKVDDQ